MDERTPEYDEVGYKKPPKHTQWKPGQSGNPKGRPKKSKDFEKLLDAELSQTLRIMENGEARTLSKRELIIKTLVTDALKGDLRALKLVLPFLVNQRVVEGFEPDAGDQAALERIVAQLKEVSDG